MSDPNPQSPAHTYVVSYPDEENHEEDSIKLDIVEIEEITESTPEILSNIKTTEALKEEKVSPTPALFLTTPAIISPAEGSDQEDFEMRDEEALIAIICDFCHRHLPLDYNRVKLFSCPHALCRYCASVNLEGEDIKCLVCGSGFEENKGEEDSETGSNQINGKDPEEMKGALANTRVQDLIFTQTEFSCPICFSDIPIGDGILLNQCLHPFCTDCIRGLVRNTTGSRVICPFFIEGGSGQGRICNSALTDAELQAFVTTEEYDGFLERSITEAELANPNSFHCKRVDCNNWFEVDPGVKGQFPCPNCKSINCLDCEVVHEGVPCHEYKEKLEQSEWDMKTQKLMQQKVKNGTVKRCPTCRVIIEKNGGCDHMHCTVCNKSFSWIKGVKPEIATAVAEKDDVTLPGPSSGALRTTKPRRKNKRVATPNEVYFSGYNGLSLGLPLTGIVDQRLQNPQSTFYANGPQDLTFTAISSDPTFSYRTTIPYGNPPPGISFSNRISASPSLPDPFTNSFSQSQSIASSSTSSYPPLHFSNHPFPSATSTSTSTFPVKTATAPVQGLSTSLSSSGAYNYGSFGHQNPWNPYQGSNFYSNDDFHDDSSDSD